MKKIHILFCLTMVGFMTGSAFAQTVNATFGKKPAAQTKPEDDKKPTAAANDDDELGGEVKTTEAAPAAEKPRKDALFAISLLGDFTLDGPTDRQRVYEGTLRLRGCKSLRPTHDLEGKRQIEDIGLCVEADVGGGKDFYRERIGEDTGVASFAVRAGGYLAHKAGKHYFVDELLIGGDWSSQDGNRGLTIRSTTRAVLFPKNNTPRYDMVKLYGLLEPELGIDARLGKSEYEEVALTPAFKAYPLDVAGVEIGVLAALRYTWLKEPTAAAVSAGLPNREPNQYRARGATILGGAEVRGYSSGLSEWKIAFAGGGGKFGPTFNFGTTFTW